jgi:hypothetical protein
MMGQRVLPQRKREPLQATHKPLLEALTKIWLSPQLMSAVTPEPFRTSNNQTLGETLSPRLWEKPKVNQKC